eukprot:TRINITY_DN6490_c0_g1_i2.p1 TRINITY_DN6490_c0_g1~~TRINITY_DN6490_c0_g1_i2.p1  ORF type:complete len:1024 (-),score=261.80 TRINITY_DN6490_c0_g1_i2:451-3522(-)
MATENPLMVVNGDSGGTQNWSTDAVSLAYASSSSDAGEQDLRLLLRGEKFRNSREMFPNRSGSAPPTFEGSLAAVGGILPHNISSTSLIQGKAHEKQSLEGQSRFGSEPAPSYYLHNQNSRLPRDWHSVSQHLGTLGERRILRSFDDSNSSFLFLSRPTLPTHKEEPEEDRSPGSNLFRQASRDWVERGPDSLLTSLGGRPKSLVDLIQEDFPRTPSPVFSMSHSASRAGNDEGVDSGSSLDVQRAYLRDASLSSAKDSELSASTSVSRTTPSISSKTVNMLGTGSVNNSSLPTGASSSILLEGGQTENREESLINLTGGSGNANPELGDVILGSVNTSEAIKLADALQNFKMNDIQDTDNHTRPRQQQAKQEGEHSHTYQLAQQHPGQQRANLPSRQGQVQVQGSTQVIYQQHQSPMGQTSRNHPKNNVANILQASAVGVQPAIQPVAAATPHVYATATAYMASGNPYFQNMQSTALFTPQYGISGYPMNATFLSPMMAGYPTHGAMPFTFDSTAAALAASMNVRSSVAATHGGIGGALDIQNLYKFGGQFGTTFQPPITDSIYSHYLPRSAEDSYNVPMLGDSLSGVAVTSKAFPNSAFYGSHTNMGLVMQYPPSSLGTALPPGSPMMASTMSARLGDQAIRFPLGANKAVSTGAYPGWQSQVGTDRLNDMKCSSFLEELKNNRSRRFELSDIIGHVVEFSSDQHGSRFIQQKLESASPEDKAIVFQEVLPHASKLMTDVFGNYVIQKFFEHGTDQQRKELANQLSGRVLSLSLQMYGCRVVQKALEVVDVDQQMQLVSELNGHVIKCVRDQNGNHVIQKCIECVPAEKIEFIISAFYGQVFTLSTHPYGCRVIQRILEHCTEEQKNNGIMDEILECICTLAEDQYGNYVAQHVLEHGKPHERSQIIRKLSGKIVQMSQHKFASNVIEKCLEYGDPKEREMIIDEILGESHENENLQTMMKDPFANYVVQKVLETSNEWQREKLLSCIKEHSHALKKYTYGKHIVVRAEKMLMVEEKQPLQ